MTAKRIRQIAWVVSTLALLGILLWAYRRFVLLHPDPTISWVRGGVTYELLNPRMLGGVLLAPWFVAVLAKSLADLPWPQRILSVLLRIAFVALVALGLSRLARTATTEKVCTVYLVDVSDSVTDEAIADASEVIKKAFDEKPKDALIRVITFAKRPRLVEAEAGDEGRRRCSGDTSSRAATRRRVRRARWGPGRISRRRCGSPTGSSAGLFEARGDLVRTACRPTATCSPRPTAPRISASSSSPCRTAGPVPGEVAIRELRMPDHVKVGETFDIHATIYASRATTAHARLYQGEALNGLEGVRDLQLKAGPNDVVWKSVVRIAGQVTYALELDQISDDKFKENNRYATTIDVPGRPSVLYVEGSPEHAGPLSQALTAQQFDVDVRPPAGFPGSLKEMERYDFLVLSRHREGSDRPRIAGDHRAVRARPRRRVPLRRRRERLRARRLVPHHHRTDPPRSHG